MLIYGALIPGWRTPDLVGHGRSLGSGAPLQVPSVTSCSPLTRPRLLVPGRPSAPWDRTWSSSIPSIKASTEQAHSILLTHV